MPLQAKLQRLAANFLEMAPEAQEMLINISDIYAERCPAAAKVSTFDLGMTGRPAHGAIKKPAACGLL